MLLWCLHLCCKRAVCAAAWQGAPSAVQSDMPGSKDTHAVRHPRRCDTSFSPRVLQRGGHTEGGGEVLLQRVRHVPGGTEADPAVGAARCAAAAPQPLQVHHTHGQVCYHMLAMPTGATKPDATQGWAMLSAFLDLLHYCSAPNSLMQAVYPSGWSWGAALSEPSGQPH